MTQSVRGSPRGAGRWVAGAVSGASGSRWTERALLGAGILLLAFAGGARLTGSVQKRADLRRFEAARVAAVVPAASHGGEDGVDTTLWSPQRIRGYQESLRRKLGAPLAVLAIPRIQLEVPVLEGTDEVTLNRGVGLIDGTPRPGEAGNVAIAGHRDGFFRGLKDVEVGDELELKTLGGARVYVIDSIRIVSPGDVSVLDPTPFPAVTLVTCYPFYFVGDAPQRYIVRAVERSPRGAR